ncbi:Glyoxalase/Bleomycin resistance protein/Dioxygenase superfamily [Rubrobacter radiotolerans]|uniref:Glyoxalase/Bleomycin resistance protein/Dioxygenase superfamily n=1 Tax=Rubrobacter radiotolerans TaxID=42256 RepID=A0A023X060_RUBRA|nr:VOC family protein [Rubrobacter radiotolerans]AHY45872.1 Glyoxalase/Bleomycin resistance protein/Dioxygenase superfamily [Rubrobacter radiotolerans]MDX5893285.1 VOC family protein [Rubrobacter radiotolerans]SMC03426.1 Catechol 2,3-dioxygenase [Rubrobacter radiotolerans DSM 5868]
MAQSMLRSVDQIAVVVRDLDASMKRYVEEFGIGPWQIYTFGPDLLTEMTFRGKDQPYRMKLALATVGETMYELIEPVEGPNTYEEFLNEHGEGLHHFGYFVEDIDAAIREMEEKGYPLLQSGRGFGTNDDGAYAYFETQDALGCIAEAIEMPPEMPPPERTYPEQ